MGNKLHIKLYTSFPEQYTIRTNSYAYLQDYRHQKNCWNMYSTAFFTLRSRKSHII